MRLFITAACDEARCERLRSLRASNSCRRYPRRPLSCRTARVNGRESLPRFSPVRCLSRPISATRSVPTPQASARPLGGLVSGDTGFAHSTPRRDLLRDLTALSTVNRAWEAATLPPIGFGLAWIPVTKVSHGLECWGIFLTNRLQSYTLFMPDIWATRPRPSS